VTRTVLFLFAFHAKECHRSRCADRTVAPRGIVASKDLVPVVTVTGLGGRACGCRCLDTITVSTYPVATAL